MCIRDSLLGFDEILLENEDSRNQKTLAMWSDAPSNSTITVQETDRHFTLRGKNFTYNFNKLTGLFAAMQYEDAVLLDKEMEFNMTRKDLLVAVGGGVVGDLGGFCAASYMRGIDSVSYTHLYTSTVRSVHAARRNWWGSLLASR